MIVMGRNRVWLAFVFISMQQISFHWLAANNTPEVASSYYIRGRGRGPALPDGTTLSSLPRWQLNLPETSVQQMDRRAVNSMNRIELSLDELSAITENTVEGGRMAVVVAIKSGRDSEALLRITMTELVEQMIADGLYGELFVVVNNGSKQPGDTERLRVVLENVVGIDRVVMGKTSPVKDRSPSVADEVILPADALAAPPLPPQPRPMIQAVLIEQYHDKIKNSGKIRALRDIYHYLYREVIEGRYRPEILFNIDAETRLRRRHYEVRDGPVETLRKLLSRDHWRRASEKQYASTVPDGLNSMVEKVRHGYIVGAGMKMVAYTDNGEPIFDEYAIAPVSHAGPMAHGAYSTAYFLAGGAIMAPYLVGLPMYRELSTWPGNIGEDMSLTITARILGLPRLIMRDVVHLNRAPNIDSSLGLSGCHRQMERWLGSLESYHLVFGKELVLREFDARLIPGIGLGVQRFLMGYDHATILRLLYHLPDWAAIFMQEYLGPRVTADDIFHGDGAW